MADLFEIKNILNVFKFNLRELTTKSTNSVCGQRSVLSACATVQCFTYVA